MISLKQVTKTYASIRALEDINLEIADGETLVIQGPSGSGKTTLLRLIAGLEIPNLGEIYIDGERVSSPEQLFPTYKRGIGFVFQRSALWPHMTVSQNIQFAMYQETKTEAKVSLVKLLEVTELQSLANRYPQQLSGGEARRVAIARALAARPRILLLDEPLTSLDPDLHTRLLDKIQEYTKQANATLLYVTHVVEEAKQVAGRLVRLERGRVVEV